MKNPWTCFPVESPFALKNDAGIIREFNKGASPEYKLHIDRLPEPFIGNRNARVVLLNLNPKWIENDKSTQTHHWYRLCRKNLSHEFVKTPFYYFDPELGQTLGYKWWRQKLGQFYQDGTEEILAKNIFAIEYCAYASTRFPSGLPGMDGDEYRNYLVENAMSRKAHIIIMQGARHWHAAIPKLRNYKKVWEIKSPQNSSIKPDTLCSPINASSFDKMLKATSNSP